MQLIDTSTMGKEHAGQKLRVLLYGEAGAGKTTFIRDWPKPIEIHDFDAKLKPIYGIPGISAYSYDLADPENCVKEWEKFLENWKKIKTRSDVATVVLDGITMLDILSLRVFNKMSGKKPLENPTLPIYGEQANFYNYFFKYMVNGLTNVNVIVTAHEFYHTDDESKIMSIQPLITGNKILPKLPAMFEEVWHLERTRKDGKEVRILHWQKYKRYIANSLVLSGGGEMEEPTYEKIQRAIEGK